MKYVRESLDDIIKEDAMGGVSSPMSTLNNTPGIGTAVPPSNGGIGSGDSWGTSKKPHTQSNKPNLKVTKKKKKVTLKKKKLVKESNINPYDKIGMEMAKMMDIKPPFEKEEDSDNQNAIKQVKFKHQITPLDKVEETQKFERNKDPKDAMNIGIDWEARIKEFKDYFKMRYNYISYDATDKEIKDFLSQKWIINRTIPQAADLFQDYILSQDLGDVQL